MSLYFVLSDFKRIKYVDNRQVRLYRRSTGIQDKS